VCLNLIILNVTSWDVHDLCEKISFLLKLHIVIGSLWSAEILLTAFFVFSCLNPILEFTLHPRYRLLHNFTFHPFPPVLPPVTSNKVAILNCSWIYQTKLCFRHISLHLWLALALSLSLSLSLRASISLFYLKPLPLINLQHLSPIYFCILKFDIQRL